MKKEKVLLISSLLFILLVVALFGTTITGYVSLPVEYKDLCRGNDDCTAGNLCCVSYEKENIGLCMKGCQNTQFICSLDSDCMEGVCCISEGSLGICRPEASQCLDAPILNKELYAKIKTAEPVLESPMPMTSEEAAKVYRSVMLLEAVAITVLIALIISLIKNSGKKKKK